MSAFFKRTKDTLCGVIISIKSGSVEGSIILSSHRQKLPVVVYTSETLMPLRADAEPDRVRAMRRALFSVMVALAQDGMKVLYAQQKRARVDRVLVSCGAPWSNTITQRIHFEQDTPFTVTPRLVDEIILHAYKKETARTPERARTLKESGKRIVEKTIIDIALNGYHIPQPYNKQASELDIAHLRGLIAVPVLTALADTEKHIRGLATMRMHTAPLILYCVLRDLYPHTANALIIDISGTATEVTLMQDSILYESVAAEYGVDSLVRDIASADKTILDEARGRLRSYRQNVLTQTQEKALARAQKRYARALEPALSELVARYALPQTVFLVLAEDMTPFFTDALTDVLHAHGGHKEKTIIPLTSEHTRHLTEAPAGAAVSAHLALAACFFHNLHACGEDMHSA